MGVRAQPPARVQAFRDQLVALGVNATVRRNRGTDIDAACGQLAARVELRERPDRWERAQQPTAAAGRASASEPDGDGVRGSPRGVQQPAART